jgi:hypothetical protein
VLLKSSSEQAPKNGGKISATTTALKEQGLREEVSFVAPTVGCESESRRIVASRQSTRQPSYWQRTQLVDFLLQLPNCGQL